MGESEARLVCDLLGIESLVGEIDSQTQQSSATSSAILGPFYCPNTRLLSKGRSIVQNGTFTGQLTHFSGLVLDYRKRPIEGATLEVWQAAPNGMYLEDNLRGQFKTDKEGKFEMYCLRPSSYKIPDNGLAGMLLKMLDRHPWRPGHIHVMVRAEGFRILTTQLYDSEDEYLKSDAAFAVKEDLVVRFEPRAEDPQAKWTLKFDFILVSEEGPKKEH